jgi:hypothetical protein
MRRWLKRTTIGLGAMVPLTVLVLSWDAYRSGRVDDAIQRRSRGELIGPAFDAYVERYGGRVVRIDEGVSIYYPSSIPYFCKVVGTWVVAGEYGWHPGP